MKPKSAPLKMLRYWIAERERMRRRRFEDGLPPAAWTSDPVLRQFRFTNISRKFDKFTIVLREHLEKTKSARDRHFSVVVFRCYNRLTTWDALSPLATTAKWDPREAVKRLKVIADRGEALCSGVWMTAGRKGEPVWRSMVRTVTAALDLQQHKTLEDTYESLLTLPYIGPFTANEMLMDLVYQTSDLDGAKDRSSFVRLGPGSVRGLRRLRGEEPGAGISQPRPTAIDWETFWKTYKDLHNNPPLLGLELTVHDVEHCICEYDKYARALEGGHLKNRYKPTINRSEV